MYYEFCILIGSSLRQNLGFVSVLSCRLGQNRT